MRSQPPAAPAGALHPMKSAANRSRSHTDTGLSLVEMVVAIGIVMIVLTSALSVFVLAKKAQQTGEGTDQATQLAYEQIERIRQMDWTDIGFRNSVYDATIQGATTTTTTTSAADYATKATIASGESTVLFASPTLGSADIKPYQTITSHNNTFRVYTAITYGRNPTLGLPATSSTTGTNQYSFKRVTVTIHWNASGNGTAYRIPAESWFAPEAEDAVPPGVPCIKEDTGRECSLP